MYNFQSKILNKHLEGLEEFYSINTQFRDLAEKDNPNAHIFKEHDYTHVLFGLGTSIEESVLDTYVIWGMKFGGKIINFYKDPEYESYR